MYYQNICKKDCIHRENGTCKFGYHLQNSIFHIDQKKCVYYASDFKKKTKLQNTQYYFT